jgi:hypothetical protein
VDLYEIISGPERRRRSRWTCTRSSAGPEGRRSATSPPGRSRRPSAGPERSQLPQILPSLTVSNSSASRPTFAGAKICRRLYFWTPMFLDANAFGRQCFWMPMFLETNVFGRRCFWMPMFLDTNVFGRQCFWTPMFLDANDFGRQCFPNLPMFLYI